MTLFLKTLPFFGGASRGGYRSTWYFYDDEQVLHKLECQEYPDTKQRWATQSQKTKVWENVYDIELFLSSGGVTTYLERMQKAFNNNGLLSQQIHNLVGLGCSFETTFTKVWSTPTYKVEMDVFKCPSEANIIVQHINLKTSEVFTGNQLLEFMSNQPKVTDHTSEPRQIKHNQSSVREKAQVLSLEDQKALRAQLHKEYSCMFIHLTKERRLYYQTCKEQDDPYKALYIEETTRRNQKNEFKSLT
jgi:hypothetical protein